MLAIISILLLLSAPIHVSTLETQVEKQFFKTMEMDILYLQSLSYGSRTSSYKLSFHNNFSYSITSTAKEVVLKRKVPDGWQINDTTLKKIAFNDDGLINKAGTIFIHTSHNRFKVVCPFGKGRCYVAEY
ncbi:hypothetical protein GCM10009001_19350 [Virgibacillus siamensis]|uniref:Competence protein ComGD n=1 Tax=Virgibacillus siamensis TaxID=480071 RepID=A0ABN1G1Y2_9BACI